MFLEVDVMVYSSFRLFCHHMIPVADSDLELGEKGEGGGRRGGGGGGRGFAGSKGAFFCLPCWLFFLL